MNRRYMYIYRHFLLFPSYSVVNELKRQYDKENVYSLEKCVLTTYYMLPCNATYNITSTI